MLKHYVVDLLAQKNNKSEINSEDSVLIQSFVELSKKPKSYENINALISLALKLKSAFDLSFNDLDPFVSGLTNFVAQKPSPSD